MFKIYRTDGSLVGITDEIKYIKLSSLNVYTSCDKLEASGIRYKRKFYSLQGATKPLMNKEVVKVVSTDAGDEFLSALANNQLLEQQLAETDEAAIELYEANIALEEINAEQDEAIIQIYEMIGGNN